MHNTIRKYNNTNIMNRIKKKWKSKVTKSIEYRLNRNDPSVILLRHDWKMYLY